jgi:hypothetical protein
MSGEKPRRPARRQDETAGKRDDESRSELSQCKPREWIYKAHEQKDGWEITGCSQSESFIPRRVLGGGGGDQCLEMLTTELNGAKIFVFVKTNAG